jgi:hypothetical protein
LLVEPFVADSARKHHVPDADILHAFNRPLYVIADPSDDEVTMIVGPDRAATLVEVGIVDSDRGPVIIHAFRPARDKYLAR